MEGQQSEVGLESGEEEKFPLVFHDLRRGNGIECFDERNH